MPYSETTWVDAGEPAITAAKLNNIEDALVSLRDFPTAGGTANAITVTAYHFSLTAGASLTFIAADDNTGATTLNVNSLGAKNFYKPGGTAQPYILAGEAVTVWYDGTSFFHKAAKTANSIVILAVDGSKRITSIDLSSIEEIYPYMFFTNGAATTSPYRYMSSVIFSSSLTEIGAYAFRSCLALGSITLPNSITAIGAEAFYGNSALSLSALPTSLITIGNDAFNSCGDSVTFDKIPDGVESIGSGAFQSCNGLTTLWIPASCTTITAASVLSAPFYDCESTLEIYCEVAEASKPAGWGAYWDYYDIGAQLSVTWETTEAAYDLL